ncbi:SMI1/KNR4 family protein [Streptomyces spiramyceticus]|uniref:SMI1/KNR4 family protein n=1 Tax=Streptomyces spiramyceticus TaxID=299717 RepID=UPI00237AF10C|nr:SMI1/KNR4 family protein [Streptomyces spiramyceticus]
MARFDQVKAAFWGVGDYGVQLPLTEEMVQEAERELGVTLPSALLDLLRVQNGGSVAAERNVFPTSQPTSWSEDHGPFSDLMGIGRRERMSSLLDTPYLVEEWELPSPIVLLSGDGHYWVGLDYRACGRSGEPSVTWFDPELSTELALAGDFRSFIEGLTRGSLSATTLAVTPYRSDDLAGFWLRKRS